MCMTSPRTTDGMNTALRVIGEGGLMGVTAPALDSLQALTALDAFPADVTQQQRTRILAELRRQGLIIETREGKQLRLQLSVKGIHRLQRAEIGKLTIRPQKQWDCLWRMVVFDIPQTHKNQRYTFISQLRRLGFVMVRQSTWYHAYPCTEVIDELVRYCGLSQFVTTAEIIRLDDSTTRTLLRHFPSIGSANYT